MNFVVKPAIILALVTLIAAAVLSQVKRITYPNILQQQKEKQNQALSLVLPGYRVGDKKDVTVDGEDFTYWPAGKETGDGLTEGYAFVSSAPGYSGDIRVMVGVDREGNILGLSILQQTETPGLGARCEEVASARTFLDIFTGGETEEEDTVPWFQKQFAGLDAAEKIKILQKGDWKPAMSGELREQNAITSLTGATITSRAVIDAVKKGVAKLGQAVPLEFEEKTDENTTEAIQ